MPEQPRDPFADIDIGDLPVTGLPASEVRRRGEAMRRRRTAAVVLGSAAAMAVVAVGGTAVARLDRSASPGPSAPSVPASGTATLTPSQGATRSGQEPTPGAVSSIPDDFPLTDGWPPIADEGEYGIVGPNRQLPRASIWTPCLDGAGTVPEGDPTDRLTADWRQPTYARSREVLTFASAAGATAYADSARAVLADCTQAGLQTPISDAAGDPGSWQGMLVSQQTGTRQATQVMQVRVRKNVVVLDVDSGEGFDPKRAPVQLAAELEPVMIALEQLLTTGSGTDGAATAAPTAMSTAPASEQVGQGDIPDLPLRDGLPDLTGDGGALRGPAAGLEGIDRRLICGEPLIVQGSNITGRLVASSSGPEYLELRQIIAYADADAAAGQLTYLRDMLGHCEREPQGDNGVGPSDRLWTTIDADTGYDTVTFGESSVLTGTTTPAGTGGRLYQMTRVGRAVFVTARDGEFTTDTLARDASVNPLTTVSTQWAGRLCSFTVAGCA